ncbi:DGQHR domain-containing protein [Telmatobacter sp. DSM 110680]|uniref:DGQHR domain-containing protein n=1 Tax=Telmatobacter sp. DSM 110680 TaxID=3036704 RepID=A0AAU7DHE4_9BACT
MAIFDYECLVSHQRNTPGAPTFLLFHAPAGEVLQWAAIKRLEEEAGAPQRQTSPAKVKAIRRFLETDERNTIPTSVIITLDLTNGEFTEPLAPSSIGRIRFEWNEGDPKPGLVIDGQHRLYGIDEFNHGTQVNLVAITNAGDMEKAFQFLVINNKASKVSQDHIRALALHYDEGALRNRLKTARLNLDPNVGYVGIVNEGEDSPFRGLISWPTTPEENRVVVPSAIEASITYIQQKKVKDFESDDVLLEFFYTIWRRIHERWPELWTAQSRLLSKVGVICMTQYMTDALTSSYDLGRLNISDPEQVGLLVDEILDTQERKFWRVPWTSSSYDTKVGRAIIVQSLTQIARNLRSGSSWFEDVEMVDATEIEADEVEPPVPPAQV